MKYNTANDIELQSAFEYLQSLADKEHIVEVKKVNPNRSLSQNNYLHILLGSFGEHFGYTLEEAKEIYKEINKDLYFYKKKGREFKRSSAELNKEDMAKSIDRFMRASAEAGHTLPPATNQEWLMQIQNEMESQRRYL